MKPKPICELCGEPSDKGFTRLFAQKGCVCKKCTRTVEGRAYVVRHRGKSHEVIK